MNGPTTPAYQKDNAFTRLIGRVAQMNAEAGMPAGSGGTAAATGYVTAIPANRVRSMNPNEAARLDAMPLPMSPEEVQMANARAAALGIVDQDDLPLGSGSTDTSDGPSEEEIEAMIPPKYRTPVPPPTARSSRMITEEPSIPMGRPVSLPTMMAPRAMPDFQNVQGFNLERGVAVIDGIEYPLPDNDIRDMKKYALTLVLDVMVIQVANALAAFGLTPEQANATAETMRAAAQANATVPGAMDARKGTADTEVLQPVQNSEVYGFVPPGSNTEGRPSARVQSVSPDMEFFLEETATEEGVQANDSGSSSASAEQLRLQLDGVPEGSDSPTE